MKQECLEMNKMEPARNINLPPTLQQEATATTSVSSFIFLSPITIFQSHSWYAWSCLLQSSQRWSEIKEQPSVWLHNSCSCTAKKQSALRKGRVWCGCINGRWYGRWRAPECVQLATKWHMVLSAAQFQTGLFPALSFQEQLRLSVMFPLLLRPCFEFEDACYFHFPTLTWETIVYCILVLASFPTGMVTTVTDEQQKVTCKRTPLQKRLCQSLW